ncbi:MAG TPA: LPS export ABC transporter periplasmic protein LptC [Candidatus Eremiobacteraceae bacterium]
MPLRRVAVVALFAIALSSCGGHPAPPRSAATKVPTASPAPGEPNYHMIETGAGGKTPFIKNYTHGALVYSLKAAGVTYSSSQRSGAFSKAIIYFYKGSAVRLTVTAPNATVDGNTYDIVMRGGVHARSSDNTTLTSDTMTYNGKTKLLNAYGHVTATGSSGMVVTGDRARADLDLQTVNITGAPVTGSQSQQ